MLPGAIVEYGVQHGSIYLIPPGGDDLEWFLASFDTEEIWSMFGFPGPSRTLMTERHERGELIVGILRRVVDRKRIGLAVQFPPRPPENLWEFGMAIPDPRDRDLRCAIEAADAWAHYFFDHLRMDAGTFRVRADNKPSIALVTRMGYRPYGTFTLGGIRMRSFRLDQARWKARLDQIAKETERYTPGRDELFITLPEPPFDPVAPE